MKICTRCGSSMGKRKCKYHPGEQGREVGKYPPRSDYTNHNLAPLRENKWRFSVETSTWQDYLTRQHFTTGEALEIQAIRDESLSVRCEIYTTEALEKEGNQ